MKQSMLTTFDNPFDPFDDYQAWFNYDAVSGYHTPNLLARIATSSIDLPESEQNRAIEQAIDEIVSENVTGMFRKVTRELPDEYMSEFVID